MSVLLLAVVTGLRLFNPGNAAAPVRVTCGGGSSALHNVAAHAVEDVGGGDCAAASPAPLLVLETGADDGVEWQRAVAPNDADCPATLPLMLPLGGCRFGSAVAAVAPVAGASYAWSLEGGDFLSGAGTDRVTIALGGGDTVKLSVAVATPKCTSTASGVIALRDAFTITAFSPGAGNAHEPRTITWQYANGTPASQVLSGTDVAPVTLANDVRSYSYTPLAEGDKSVVLQARSGTPPTGRAHAAGRGTAAASDCDSARAVASYHVDCKRPDATIFAPASVNAAAPFTARVHIDSFTTAKWTIVNGTPATATGDSVTIKATGSAPVDISVVVTSGGCSASGTTRVAIDAASCDNPAAELTLLARADCSTVLQGHFTGTPPFRGTWSDGVPFVTNASILERPVLAAGSYSINHFSDALCAGAASNSVNAAPSPVSAVLSAPNGSCANGAQVVATFNGTPPFRGTWWDGVAFSTSARQIGRPVTQGGLVSLQFSDATCGPVSSSSLQFNDPATITLALDPSTPLACAPIGSNVKINATIKNGIPPYVLTWSDGQVQSLPVTTPEKVTRTFAVPAAGLTVSITAAHDAVCTLAPAGPVSVGAVPGAGFSIGGTTCAGRTATATLFSAPVSGASVGWSIANGTIVAGGGPNGVNFIPNAGAGTLTCTITTPRGCTATSSQPFTGWTAPAAPQPLVTQGSTVAAGSVVTVAWTIDKNTLTSSITASAGNQPSTPQCNGSLCSSSYTASVAGSVTFTVRLFGRCGDIVPGTTTLTVQ